VSLMRPSARVGTPAMRDHSLLVPGSRGSVWCGVAEGRPYRPARERGVSLNRAARRGWSSQRAGTGWGSLRPVWVSYTQIGSRMSGLVGHRVGVDVEQADGDLERGV